MVIRCWAFNRVGYTKCMVAICQGIRARLFANNNAVSLALNIITK